jgi:hypothetical protein
MTPNYGAFKRWFVKRPDGGCQVLLPLSELDTTVDEACTPIRNRLVQMERALADRDRRIDEGDAIPASFYKRLEAAEKWALSNSVECARCGHLAVAHGALGCVRCDAKPECRLSEHAVRILGLRAALAGEKP